MFCPSCGGEYRDGFTRCADCDVDLVAALPTEDVHPEGDLVRVFSTADAALIPVVESLFDDAGIRVMSKGEGVQDLFGLGRLGGANLLLGPVEFFVRPDEAEAALALLAGLQTPVAEDAEGPAEDAPET